MGLIQKQTLQGTFYSYLGVAAGAVTQIFLFPQFLEKSQIGLMAVLLSYNYILAAFANLGFNTAGIRLFPHFRNIEKKHQGYLFWACAVSLLGFVVCMLGLVFLKPIVLGSESALFQQYFFFLFPLTFFTLYFNVFDNYAKALYDSVTGTMLSQFAQRFFQLLAIVAYVLGRLSFEQFMWIWLAAICLPTLLMMAKIIADGNWFLKPDFKVLDKPLRQEMINICLFSVVSGLSTQVITHIDKVMVENYLGLSDAGVYAIASFFGTIITLPATALYKISGTLIADAWKENRLGNIATIYEKSCISQLIIGFWVFLGIAVNIDFVFGTVLPVGYETGKWVIIWIGIGKLFDMATGVNGVILTTSKYYRYDTYFFILLIGVVVLCNRLLIPPFGMIGAAIAAAIAIFFFNLFRFGFVWWKFRFQPFTWATPKILAWGGILLVLNQFLPEMRTGLLPQVFEVFYRSAFITVLFLGGVYQMNVLPDINQLATKTWKKLVKR